jgi:mannitol/fructose-specific phosphotransferase system IIA component (Ntr-type)
MAVFDEIIRKSLVCLNMAEPEGYQVLSRMVELAVSEGLLPAAHLDEAITAVLKREQSASTALPDGIALPHGRTDCVKELVCMIGIHPSGVEFGAPDGLPTRIFVQLLVPATVGCNHIHFLANLSRRLLEPSVRDALLKAATREQVLSAITGRAEEGTVR